MCLQDDNNSYNMCRNKSFPKNYNQFNIKTYSYILFLEKNIIKRNQTDNNARQI